MNEEDYQKFKNSLLKSSREAVERLSSQEASLSVELFSNDLLMNLVIKQAEIIKDLHEEVSLMKRINCSLLDNNINLIIKLAKHDKH